MEMKAIFSSHGGIVNTKILRDAGITYHKIRKLIADGKIERIKNGYYQYLAADNFSDVPVLASLFPDAVLYLESALYAYDYTDRTPAAWHLAVDARSSRKRFHIAYPLLKPHFIQSEKFLIGIDTMEINGISMKIYDRERTICDCLLHRNKMDAETFNQAVKSYLKDSKRKIPVLAGYAQKLKVEKKVKEVLGVWL